MPTTPPTLTAAPTSPDRSDRATFTARAIALDNFTKNVNIPEMQVALNNVYANAMEADVDAAAALASQGAAAGSAASALNSSNSAASSAATATAQLALNTAQAVAAATAKDTATAQANLAIAAAASASSVLQQDLSAIAQALHRSPNAITAFAVYDTAKDSDGGAWTERMQHTSWFNEALNGTWLPGGFATEAAARAATGAATGAYFQLTTDGKHYKLNAGSGITETTRGNKNKFPRLAAIVAESTRIVIYDLTAPGCPMWMVLWGTAATPTALTWQAVGAGVTSVAALNGIVAIGGGNSTGLITLTFPKDDIKIGSTGAWSLKYRTIGNRHALASYTASADSYALGSAAVNAIVMIVLSDAPVDPTTGLQVPTIAIAQQAGITIIKNDGTPIYSASTNVFRGLYFTPSLLFTLEYTTSWSLYALDAAKLGPSFALGNPNTRASSLNSYYKGAIANGGRDIVLASYANQSRVGLSRQNERNFDAGLGALITESFNTGYAIGDVRRTYLADTAVESVSGANLITNGDFTTDMTGWTAGANSTISAVGGQAKSIGATSAATLFGYTLGAFAAGQTVTFTFDVISDGASTTARGILGTTLGGGDLSSGTNPAAFGPGQTFTYTFTAAVASCVLWFWGSSATVGNYILIDNVVAKKLVSDRSYKAAVATVYGTLTKSTVGAAAQLVAYSGFSAANYLREGFSADLDMGTGEVAVGAWANYASAAVSTIACREAAAGAYIRLGTDATGKLTATIFDGTTTRTVTTTASYNTGAWLHAEAKYSAGRLSIWVNGVEVASVTGAPLLALNNASAVLTIGNSFALDAPFPGSLALLDIGATAATAEQSAWMYAQEKMMFRDGAQVTLPASTAVQDLTYDESQDKWVASQATFESSFTGLVRTGTAAPSAGSFSKVAATGGIKLSARTGTNPGVDVTVPAYGLREELVRRSEAAAKASRPLIPFEFDTASFTATTVNTSNQLTLVASVVGTPYIGMGISGTGIPAGTTITGISGATYTISANATAGGTAVAMGQTDFTLPAGYTAVEVLSAGAGKREGSTKDFTRLYDGFKETTRFAVSPGSAVWVRINARKE